ncbi:MAG TPA: hypothetical protein VFZ43_10565 [Anaerolineales bacterium]
MTTLVSASSAGGSALRKEQELFGELFVRLRDAFMNRIFDLRPERAARRRRYLIFLFFFVGFLITLTHENYSLSRWSDHTQDIFLFLFNRDFALTFVGNPFENMVRFAWGAFTDPHTLQYVPILLASFFIALQSAALYLADVFELEDIRVARKFVSAVALSGSNETIRISKGDISEQSRESPTFLIGGPGRVIVDLDSVALFEKPDGTPRVIGPTGKEPGGRATLEGFERFREAIDIRDHYTDIEVKSRSRDGIPVHATDVRMMFSVHRDGQPVSVNSQFPYPFGEEAIEQLIYKSTSKVTPDSPNPSKYEFKWIQSMISLIRGELAGFMSQHNLTEYLASTGTPESEKEQAQEDIIAAQARQFAVPAEEAPPAREVKPPPEFTPRREISNLFSQFAQKFTDKARERGVELHWIGVGTWKTPAEIVPEKHLEAWKLSQENLYRGNPDMLASLEDEALIQKMVILIQDVPVAAYQRVTDEDKEHNNAIRSLLLAYRQQLIEAADFMYQKGETVSPRIIQAIDIISKVMGFTDWHWVGDASPESDRAASPPAGPPQDSAGGPKGAPPANQPQGPTAGPESPRTPEAAFDELVRLVGGNRATAERLVRLEGRVFPDASRLELIEQAIARLRRDRQ